MSEEIEEVVEDVSSEEQNNDETQAENVQHEEVEISSEVEELTNQLSHLESLANMNPEFRDSEEYKELVDKLKAASSNEEDTEEDTEEHEEEAEEEEVDEDSDNENEEEDEKASNVFGIGKKSSKQSEELEFEIDEEMANYIQNHYGLDDVGGFFESVDKWRNQAQEGAKTKSEYDELYNDLVALPTEIKAAITAFTNREDYVSAFNSSGGRLDYDKPFENQDKELVVQRYFNEEVSNLKEKMENGSIDDEDYEERVEMLYKASKNLYNSDKKMVSQRRADAVREQEKLQESFKSSAISSVDVLKSKYPNFSDRELQKVRQRLVDGNIESLFFNKDGTYKESAAIGLAFAEYGEEVIQSLIEQAEKKGESKANEAIVKKGAKTPRSSSTKAKKDRQAIDAISHLPAFKEDPYE